MVFDKAPRCKLGALSSTPFLANFIISDLHAFGLSLVTDCSFVVEAYIYVIVIGCLTSEGCFCRYCGYSTR